MSAFLGAEGYGRNAGAGNGRVELVLNTNDSGPGSLRQACIDASGLRNVVFRTGGEWILEEDFKIVNRGITLHGQTAPGGGVTLRSDTSHPRAGTPRLWIGTSDVCIRYIRVRPGAPSKSSGSQDAIAIGSDDQAINGVMVDHCSASFSTDEILSAYGVVSNVTIQHTLLSEPLDGPTPPHQKLSKHGYFSLWDKMVKNVSIHHVAMVHGRARGPRIESDDPFGGFDLRNCLVYNIMIEWTALRAHNSNLVNCIFLTGPDTQDGILMDSAHYRNYLSGNVVDWVDVGAAELGVRNTTPTEYSHPFVTTQHVAEAYDDMMANVGASLVRDEIDLRILVDIENKTGHVIDMPSDVGGYPYIDPGTPLEDDDMDGVPNQYWVERDLVPQDIWLPSPNGTIPFHDCMQWFIDRDGSTVPPPIDPVAPTIPPTPPATEPMTFTFTGTGIMDRGIA